MVETFGLFSFVTDNTSCPVLTSLIGLNDGVVTHCATLCLISLTCLDFFYIYGCLCYHLGQAYFFPLVFPKDMA